MALEYGKLYGSLDPFLRYSFGVRTLENTFDTLAMLSCQTVGMLGMSHSRIDGRHGKVAAVLATATIIPTPVQHAYTMAINTYLELADNEFYLTGGGTFSSYAPDGTYQPLVTAALGDLIEAIGDRSFKRWRLEAIEARLHEVISDYALSLPETVSLDNSQ